MPWGTPVDYDPFAEDAPDPLNPAKPKPRLGAEAEAAPEFGFDDLVPEPKPEAPPGPFETPYNPFAAFAPNQIAERGSVFREAPKPAAGPGVFGESFGMLTPEQSRADLDARFADFNRQQAHIANLEKLLGQTKNPQQRRALEVQLNNARLSLPDIDQLQLMEGGDRPLASKTALRSGAENAIAGAADSLLSVPEYAGIVKGYVNGKVDDDSLLRWAQGTKDYVGQLFPGDAARQGDFSQQLASGLGFVATLYGAGAAAALAKAGPKTVAAVLAAMGTAQMGAGGFEEATAELNRAREKAAAAGDEASVSEYDRFLKTLGYSAIGATAALPVARTLMGVSGEGPLLSRALQGGLEQGAQMAGAQAAANIVTQQTTNPERPTLEGVGQAGGVGAILGGLFNAALGRRGARAERPPRDNPDFYGGVKQIEGPESPPPSPPAAGEGPREWDRGVLRGENLPADAPTEAGTWLAAPENKPTVEALRLEVEKQVKANPKTAPEAAQIMEAFDRSPPAQTSIVQAVQAVQQTGKLSGAANRVVTALRDPAVLSALAPRQPKEVDPLGYYSKALEEAKALPQERGTPEQFTAMLRKAGVKESEIAATGLGKFLGDKIASGQNSVTKAEIVDYLANNRVSLKENVRSRNRDHIVAMQEKLKSLWDQRENLYDNPGTHFQRGESGDFTPEEATEHARLSGEIEALQDQIHRADSRVRNYGPKWAKYSLDPANPTYQETVLHLGPTPRQQEIDARIAEINREKDEIDSDRRRYPQLESEHIARLDALTEEYKQLNQEEASQAREVFRDSHWDEPNIVAHARTQITNDAKGRKVFNIDELQSGWGQKLREGGARDAAKIADLEKRINENTQQMQGMLVGGDALFMAGVPMLHPARHSEVAGHLAKINTDGLGYSSNRRVFALNELAVQIRAKAPELFEQIATWIDAYQHLSQENNRLRAELGNAKSAATGHPLINTTDQWVTTAMRRLIKQAVDAGADGISLTPGKAQNERFDLSRNGIQAMRWAPETHSLQIKKATDFGSPGWSHAADVKQEDLPAYVGAEMARRLLAADKRTDWGIEWHEIENLADVEIGGEGMKAAYDNIYPRILSKLLQKLDPSIKAEKTRLFPHDYTPRPGSDHSLYYQYAKNTPFENEFTFFPLTAKAKQAIQSEGQPLFALSPKGKSNETQHQRPGSGSGRVQSGSLAPLKGAPEAPFTGNGWWELGFKRVLQHAVDTGYDAVALTTPEQINKATMTPIAVAKKFYGENLPRFIDKYLKQWGAERSNKVVSGTEITAGEFPQQPYWPITEKMRHSLQDVEAGGQALFATARAEMQKAMQAMLDAGKPVILPPEIASSVFANANAVRQALPSGNYVAALSKIEPDPDAKGNIIATFTDSKGRVHLFDGTLDDLFANRALYDVGETNGPGVCLIRLSPARSVDQGLRGEVRHEAVHALRRQGLLTGPVWDALVSHASRLHVMDVELGDYIRAVRPGEAVNVPDNRSLRQAYKELYRNRRNLDTLLAEESVAHMVELYSHGILTPERIAPVRSIVEMIFNGDFVAAGKEDDAALGRVQALGLARDEELPAGDRRILRQESATLRQDGSVIRGRLSRMGGSDVSGRANGGKIQPIGKTEPFNAPGFIGEVTATKPADHAHLRRIGAPDSQLRYGGLAYKLYARPQTNKQKRGPLLADALISQHLDGAWEVSFMQAYQEGQGLMTKLYQAIEKDLGIHMSPSGLLTQEGYQWWKKRSPASVKWHQWAPSDNTGWWVSPRHVSEQLDLIGKQIATFARVAKTDPLAAIDLEKAKQERAMWLKLFGRLSPGAKAARDTMFALRPLGKDGQPISNDPAFRRWFGDSKVVDAEGNPLIVYHGTLADFHAFDPYRTNRQSNVGAGFYFSSKPEDTGANYSTVRGPDIRSRIEDRVKRYLDDGLDGEEAEARAFEDLGYVHDGLTLPVYLKIENPVILSNDGRLGTFLDYSLNDDEEADDYGRPETGKLVDFIDALRRNHAGYEGNIEPLIADLAAEAVDYDGLSAKDIYRLAIESEAAHDIQDEEGRYVYADLIRQSFEDIGYDGIIDHTVDSKFPRMQGIHGATHYIVFKPTQIKSAFNSGKFDPDDPNILAALAGESAKNADLTAKQRAEAMLKDGAEPQAIWDATGWYKSDDGRWKFEIDDSKAKIKLDAKAIRLHARQEPEFKYPLLLEDFLDHPALFRAYPQLRGIRVSFDEKMPFRNASFAYGKKGSKPGFMSRLFGGKGEPSTPADIELGVGKWDAKASAQDLLPTLMHEIQHGIQMIEDFAMGASPLKESLMVLDRILTDQLTAQDRALIKRYDYEHQLKRIRRAQNLAAEHPKEVYLQQLPKNEAKPMASALGLELYLRAHGEIEAREVEQRVGMSAEAKQGQMPGESAYPDEEIGYAFKSERPELRDKGVFAIPDSESGVFEARPPRLEVEGLGEKVSPLRPGMQTDTRPNAQVGAYIEARLTPSEDVGVADTRIYTDYLRWAQQRQERPVPLKVFTDMLREAGFQPSRIAGAIRYFVNFNK